MISGLIKNFVANFNYANNQVGRGGCLMFSNTTLTTMLENISQDLRDALVALSHQENITQKEMGDEFCRLVRKVLTGRSRHISSRVSLVTRVSIRRLTCWILMVTLTRMYG